MLVQALALVAAAFFAIKGARILNEPPQGVTDNFDAGVLWLGLALLATLLVAWRPTLPKVSAGSWAAALREFWRAHWVELLLFTLIFGFGIFMRTYRFGGTLPPADALCCEEHINGGVAYMALQGERPLLFPLERWGSAAGFLIFGENTLGLRFFFVVMGIATLVPLYLLLRQMVSVPVALFGLALYAAAWWPSLANRRASEGTFFTVLFAFFLVRGLKTKSPLMFLGVGILSALISYEYEAFRPVPFVAAGFVGIAALREVLLRHPLQLRAAWERGLALLKVAWRPALVFAMAAGIVLTPLIIGTQTGFDLYLTSVHRNEGDRGGDRFVDDWQRQAKWATQLFLPLGPKEYRSQAPRDFPGSQIRGFPGVSLLDPLTASLAMAGLAAGIVFSFRGFRLFFVSWFVLTLAAGALLLQLFAAWKFIGLVPVALVLGMLFVDDVRSLVARAFGPWARRALAGLLVLGAAFSFWWNADKLFNVVAPTFTAERVYGRQISQFYTYCNYLRERGPENHTFAFDAAIPNLGFAFSRDNLGEQRGAWGDFIWVCHDLDGTALPAPEEAWPLRGLPAGPTTLVFSSQRGSMEERQLIDELNRAYPGLGQPDRRIVGPPDTYTIIAYEFASGEELARHGLWADCIPAGSNSAAVSRVDPVSDLACERESLPLSAPFTVHWQGIVYVEEGETLRLQAESDDPVEVRLDGQVVYSTRSGEREEAFIDLLPGWHPVEITLDKRDDGGTVRLIWARPGGAHRAVQPEDLFPLAKLRGWLHQRALGLQGDRKQLITQRLDFAPHYALTTVLKLEAEQGELFLTEDRWRGVWTVDEPGDYLLRVKFMAGTMALLVDGELLATEAMSRRGQGELAAEVALANGRHTLELVQQLNADVPWTGATLSIWRRVPPNVEGEAFRLVAVPLRVTPY